jgi:hypothetical protein
MAETLSTDRYDYTLVDRTVEFLVTRDPALFPFARRFDERRMASFVRDLREALADVVDTGSARKTAATGFLASTRRLRGVVDEWEAAGGDWPPGADPAAPVTALGSFGPDGL